MPQPADQACANCRYWMGLPHPPSLGECRRDPPVHLQFVTLGGRIFSTGAAKVTPQHYWCGQWHASGGPSPDEQTVAELAQHLVARTADLRAAVQSQKK